MKLRLTLPIALILCSFSAVASAAGAPEINAYALLVASNKAGPGQQTLAFSHADAQRMRDVLAQLGGYSARNITTVLDPSPKQIVDALAAVSARLRAHAARGERTVFLFYYSGHARARALNMGHEELPLAQLRGRLTKLPATVTVAILDACQTGAISKVKGVTPAADFSYNAVNDLNTAGLAVMTSSSASELSQEAKSLGSSYFTHNLVVGLRGAADADGDGTVTLSEAYRYAYNRTLVATAATAVGKQHVTLETRLRGKGEMVLTYPGKATSSLLLPAGMRARVLVHKRGNRVVVAEVVKSSGKALRLALPPGRYVALARVHGRSTTVRCPLTLAERGLERLTLRGQGCAPIRASKGLAVKGGVWDPYAPPPPPEPDAGVHVAPGPRSWHETWILEVGIGALGTPKSDYTQTLEAFRFNENVGLIDAPFTAHVMFGRHLFSGISLHVGWTKLDSGDWSREAFDLGTDARDQFFSWSAHAVGIYVRWTLPMGVRWFQLYIQGGGGLAWANTTYTDEVQASPEVDDQTHFGAHLELLGGIAIMPWRHFGFYTQGAWIYAPVIKNNLGETHNSGGGMWTFGLRFAL
ncbi:MAG: caspase family protein [Myxococcales bacterium]|nr:caspase family protein [Myxococcales bacterium]